MAPASPDAAAAGDFRRFPDMPAELRLKVWHASFEARVVELHTRKPHYAADDRYSGLPDWQSRCANPAALAVSGEARCAALERYTVAIPLERIEGSSRRHRSVYVAPDLDTLAVLGELTITKIALLMRFVRMEDPRGVGLRHLGLNAGCFASEGAASLLKVYAKEVFKHLDELVLFMYDSRFPPPAWEGGRCELVDVRDGHSLRRFELGRGAQLKVRGKWMAVGRWNEPFSVKDLVFVDDERRQRVVDAASEVESDSGEGAAAVWHGGSWIEGLKI
jgi:hypothetical protein